MTTQRKPLLLLGAGTSSANYAEAFRDHPGYVIEGFVEDRELTAPPREIEGLPVYRTEDALGMSGTHAAMCCIGSPERRSIVERFEAAGFEFATLISPEAIIHPKAHIEPGCLISDQTDVDPYTRIGRHSIVSAKVSFGHHSSMGPFGFIGPAAIMAGNCTIGEGCYIGMSAVIRDHITIGDGATIGAGAVVIKDVEPGATVVGNPARPLAKDRTSKSSRTKRRQPVLMLGAGEQAASYAENVADHPDYEIVGFVQDIDPERRVSQIEGRPVYFVDDVKDWHRTHRMTCCIGSMKKKEAIRKCEAMGFEFVTLVANTAIVSPKAELGPGCYVSHTGQVSSFARVGAHTMIGRMTMVGHHSTVGPFSLIAGSAVIGGGAKIGEGCFVGMGALIRDHVTLGDNVTVGVGAVVVDDVPSGTTVVGNPARAIATKDSGAALKQKKRHPLLLLGAGGMAENYVRLFADHPEYEITGLVQDLKTHGGRKTLEGKPVFGVDEALTMAESHYAICCIGATEKRAIIERFEAAGFRFATLLASSVRTDSEPSIGQGCFINHDTSIAPFSSVGAHTLVMRKVIVGHHCSIGPYSTIGPGAMIAGWCRIGSGCFIGMGALIKDHVTLGDDVTVGVGAVVVSDVPSGTTVVGNPAKPLPQKNIAVHTGKTRRPLLILGAGGMAHSIAQTFRNDPGFEVVGFVQNVKPSMETTMIEGKPVHWFEDALNLSQSHAVISIIGSRMKRALVERFESAGFEFINLIAPTAIVDPAAKMGVGCLVTHFASIEAGTRVGNHGFFGRQSLLAHHTSIGPYAMVAPGAMIAGENRIGSGCFIGMGAILKDHLTIGDDATIGAGAVVVKDVPPGATVVGNPARVLRVGSTEGTQNPAASGET